MKTCVYPGSFDPFTLGHLDVIRRASEMFDKVVIAVGKNSSKKYLFTEEERIQMIKKCTQNIPNVIVDTFSGLLADYVYELGSKVIIKGIRNPQDYDYERLLHEVGATQQRGIETFTIFAKPGLNHVSSSAAKAVCENFGFVDEYVPLLVKRELERKIWHKDIYGVTGTIGSGKSYITDKLCNSYYSAERLSAYNLDLDKVAYDILHTRTEEVYIELRRKIIKDFMLTGGLDGITIDRKELGEVVFNNKDELTHLNDLMRIPILTRVRKTIQTQALYNQIILLNGALLVEANMLPICNNNIILITTSPELQVERLKKRGYTQHQIDKRFESQLSTVSKRAQINQSISQAGCGQLYEYSNTFQEGEYYRDPDYERICMHLYVSKRNVCQRM